MPKRREGVQRQRFIIHQLTKKQSTFEEIQDFLQFQETFSDDRLTCSIRTMQRDIQEILRDYDIEIKNDRSTNEYYIAHDGREGRSERLMETFDLFNAIKIGNSFGNHLIFENRTALGAEHMNGLLHAIRNRVEVGFSYKKFNDGSVSSRNVKPIAIKEARNRWYLLAKEADGDVVKNFSLDRISNLEISSRKFKAIGDYDVKEEFKYNFGIINGTGEEPQRIVLSFTSASGRYINSLPLHHTQKEILHNETESRFEYFLTPTYDFQMEILSHGDKVRVLEPESLKNNIVAQLKNSLAGYK